MGKRIGNQTLAMTTPVPVAGFAAVAGKKEGQGPLTFDYVAPDATFGEKTWEKAESKMQRDALDR
ncbi:MAG: stage V sporulation protein AD, partial [Eubacteriales bacterium]|nr:stage V sporulation protein AD [Eubacteriales bacterium]